MANMTNVPAIWREIDHQSERTLCRDGGPFRFGADTVARPAAARFAKSVNLGEHSWLLSMRVVLRLPI